MSTPLRLEVGHPPWAPAAAAELVEAWSFWDHPRAGYFIVDGQRVAFHRHDSVGDFSRGPSLWTYRPLTDPDLAALALPPDQWGAPWQRVYDQWHTRTPAIAWALADHDLAIIDAGAFTSPVDDDIAWAAAFWRRLAPPR
ncbi:MAG TPA: hypothetical protein PKW35_25445 [Nannocystaceae bacterium]|nr:hypothetical protein [Nannocystaceae bacterium]